MRENYKRKICIYLCAREAGWLIILKISVSSVPLW
jgi:hypothetical protein